MTKKGTLLEILEESAVRKGEKTLLDNALDASMKRETFDSNLIAGEFTHCFSGSLEHPLTYLDKLQQVFTLNLLLDLDQKKYEISQQAKTAVQQLSLCPFAGEFQLAKVLIALNKTLMGEDVSYITPCTFRSGASPVEWGRHWYWAQYPQLYLHAQLGVAWAILGHLTNSDELKNAAESLALWQRSHTLDHRGLPLTSLFIRESETSLSDLLLANSLLFHAVASICDNASMEDVAISQEKHLLNQPSINHAHLTQAAIQKSWLDAQLEPPKPVVQPLVAYFSDAETGVKGMRGKDSTLLCLSQGYNTGLGSFCTNDVSLVNYGPQQLPLGECQGFGVVSFSSPVKESEFSYSSKMRSMGVGDEKPVWLDVSQTFSEDSLDIEVKTYKPQSGLAFTFYLKADACFIDADQQICKDSLEQFEGRAGSLVVKGVSASLKIEGPPDVQVIPLAGGDNFWGANYLVAYPLSSSYKPTSWTVKLHHI